MSVLKIHMTYQCTAECEHCRFRCNQSPTAVVNYDLALECIATLKQLNNLELVVLMGGEPGLFPDLTNDLTSAASKLGLSTRIETNAFWATSEQDAHQFLEPLYSKGASLAFSLDSFHEPFVSLDYVERAIRVSDKLGGKYSLEMAYLEHPDSNNQRDIRTNELLKDMETRLGRAPCCHVYQGSILFNGRAADKLAEHAAKGRGVPKEACNQVPWWSNGALETLELLILDPEGYLSKGCGISIGTVAATPIAAILNIFDARSHPVFSTLIESGPLGLAREAAELGYLIKKDYADKCHLCQEAREVLRNKYPEYIAPLQHYL